MSTSSEAPDETPEQPVQAAVGKVKKALGWATADRRVEAEGAIEELDATEGETTSADGTDGEVLDEAELHVRNDHGDLAPSAEPDEQPAAADPKVGG